MVVSPHKFRATFSDFFDLVKRFDLITAPFRVFQILETDTQISGVFDCIRNHVLPEGNCILTAFSPNRGREELLRTWESHSEVFDWEVPIDGGSLTRHHRTARIDEEKFILYSELVYRRYENDALVDETVLGIAARVYYPAEFTNLIEAHGLRIVNRWGGYAGEQYGEGPELVVQFAL